MRRERPENLQRRSLEEAKRFAPLEHHSTSASGGFLLPSNLFGLWLDRCERAQQHDLATKRRDPGCPPVSASALARSERSKALTPCCQKGRCPCHLATWRKRRPPAIDSLRGAPSCPI